MTRSRPGRPCSTCTHPQVEAINGDLLFDDNLYALEKRWGVSRQSMRTHRDAQTGHVKPIGDKERETARAAAAIRAWERAKAEIPLLAERLERERAEREDAQRAQLQQERFQTAKLGALKREQRLAELDERMARWGTVLDTITREVVEAVKGRNGGRLVDESSQLMALLDRGVKVSTEVRGLIETDARLSGEWKPDGGATFNVNLITGNPIFLAYQGFYAEFVSELPEEWQRRFDERLAAATPKLGEGGR